MKITVLKLAKNDLKEIYMYLSDFGDIPPKKFRDSFSHQIPSKSILPRSILSLPSQLHLNFSDSHSQPLIQIGVPYLQT
jgi:hypothetical protein